LISPTPTTIGVRLKAAAMVAAGTGSLCQGQGLDHSSVLEILRYVRRRVNVIGLCC
jgi:hypothetical protein